jgi:hypothetical protein
MLHQRATSRSVVTLCITLDRSERQLVNTAATKVRSGELMALRLFDIAYAIYLPRA